MEAAQIGTIPKQTLTLTPRLRQELKRPLGTLIRGPSEETMKELSKIIQKQNPECIISVGDVVSQNMLEQNIKPNIIIVDNKVMRKSSEPIRTTVKKRICVKNPAGSLTAETWAAIEEALRFKQPTQVFVEGEEDLMTLVAVLKAPKNSLVVYGQPHEGIVAVKADKAIKERVRKLVDAMETLPKS